MRNKSTLSITKSKWKTLSDSAKRKMLMDLFSDIELCLHTQKYSNNKHSETTSLLFLSEIKLFLQNLTDETDTELLDIYSSTIDSVSLMDIYNTLRTKFDSQLASQKDFHFLSEINIIKGDKQKDLSKIPLILILDNLRSAFNTGSLIRTAECLNIEEVIFCGHTPKPSNEKVKNTAMGTQNKIQWSYYDDTQQAINYVKHKKYTVCALETVGNAISLYDNKFANKTALIAGNEALGISEEILIQCDKIIKIPVLGWKNSLNVATATAVCCFEIYRQFNKLGG